MSNPGEVPTLPPLVVEQALENATRHRSESWGFGQLWGSGLQYPKELGLLAVDRVNLDPDYDASLISTGLMADFTASYEMDDREAASSVRQRSMAWLDWLAQNGMVNVLPFAYRELVTVAAEHGDADTVRQIVEDPKRLWLGVGVSVSSRDSEPALDQLSTNDIGHKVSDIVGIMTRVPEGRADQVRAAVMPTLQSIVAKFVRRDLTNERTSLWVAGIGLLNIGTPEALAELDKLVGAMPMTPARVDLLIEFAEKNERFTAAAAEAVHWHDEKFGLAQATLAAYIETDSAVRNTINYPRHPQTGKADAAASQPIAAAIVDQIPNSSNDTSAIETSVAYANLPYYFFGNTYGEILRCVRILTGNPHLELTDPQFGFAATFENDENNYARGRVTVVDANVPDGRIVIDLSNETLRHNVYYESTLFLCRIIQAEKNRRAVAA